MREFWKTLVLSALLLAAPVFVNADPPARVARLSYMDGPVIFSPAGQDEWFNAEINRPVITGDRIWSDISSRAELQLGRAVFRFGDNTSIAVLNLDNNLAQVQLTQGVINLNIRSVRPDQAYEINTPNLVFSTRQPGDYLIDVNKDGTETIVTVRSGQAEVYGDRTSYIIPAQQTFSFTKTDLGNYQRLTFAANDDFDRWCYERERLATSTVSARYVSPEIVGYEDLDRYGSWTQVDVYGHVWIPNNVGSDWAPYREGHWAWISPWGWTWVDHEEWGYAPFHYGRWAYVEGRWGWIPGPITSISIYAPALVGFLGGINFVFGSDGISWVPLGYNDIYQPPYVVSQQYFSDINTSGTFLQGNQVRKHFNRRNERIVFSNQNITNAVTAVPKNIFIQSKPVSKTRVSVTKDAISKAELLQAPALAAPQKINVSSNEAKPSVQPPQNALSRSVVEKAPKTAAPKNMIDTQESVPSQNAVPPQIGTPTPVIEQNPKTPVHIVQPGIKEPDRPRPLSPVIQNKPEVRQTTPIIQQLPAPEERKPEIKQPVRVQQQPIQEERKSEVRQPAPIIQQLPAPEERKPEVRQPVRVQQQPIQEERKPEVRQPAPIIQQLPAPEERKPEVRQIERIQPPAPVQREIRQPEIKQIERIQQPVHEESPPPATPQTKQPARKKADHDKGNDD